MRYARVCFLFLLCLAICPAKARFHFTPVYNYNMGLSLSCGIVVKGCGGTITVDTKENEFTQFTTIIPVQS
jgi:hypothetical protein